MQSDLDILQLVLKVGPLVSQQLVLLHGILHVLAEFEVTSLQFRYLGNMLRYLCGSKVEMSQLN